MRKCPFPLLGRKSSQIKEEHLNFLNSCGKERGLQGKEDQICDSSCRDRQNVFLLEKFFFEKSLFSTNSRESRDLENPETVENKGESDDFLENLENL